MLKFLSGLLFLSISSVFSEPTTPTPTTPPATAPETASSASPTPAPTLSEATKLLQAPEVSGIPGQEVEEGKNFKAFDLKKFVTDPDHKTNQIQWAVTGNKDLKVVLSGSRVTLRTPDKEWNGSETLTFTATDPDGATGSESQTYTVLSINDKPKLKRIANQNIQEGATFAPIKLDDIVTDIDHKDSEISWSAEAVSKPGTPDLGELFVNIDAKRVAVIQLPDTNWYGSANVVFTAVDGEGAEVTTKATFKVKSVNDLPVLQNIPPMSITEGDQFPTITLDDLVSDSDNPVEKMKWSIRGSSKLKISIDADRIASIKIPNEEYASPGPEKFTVSVRDPKGGSATGELVLEVKGVNDLPELAEIAGQTVDEGKRFKPINLGKLVQDKDNKKNEMKWRVEGAKDLQVSINAGGLAQIAIPGKEWNGSETLTFTVTDPAGGSASQTVTFTVTSINDIPKAKNLPPQNIQEGEEFQPIKLDELVEDKDHKDAELQWSFVLEGGDKAASEALPEILLDADHVATIKLPDENWWGKLKVLMIVTDPEGGSDTVKAKFAVRSINDVPILSKLQDQSIEEGGEFQSITLDDFVQDDDHSKEELKWRFQGAGGLKVVVDKDRNASIKIPDSEWSGPAQKFTVTVRDPKGGVATGDVTFTVNSVNDIPILQEIPEQTVEEGKKLRAIDLKSLVQDADHKFTELKWKVFGNKDLKINVNPRGKAEITAPDENWNGSETVTFEVSDPEGGTASQTVTFTVNSVNDIPVMKDIPSQNIDEGKNFADIRLDDFVEDLDHKDTELMWDFSQKTIQASKDGSELLISADANRVVKIEIPNENWNGSVQVTFAVADPEDGKATKTATFTVKSINDIPVLQKIQGQSINEGEDFSEVALADLVEDADHNVEKLKWSVSGQKELQATVNASGVLIVKTPNENWFGAEKLNISVSDPEAGKASMDLNFKVLSVNDLPVLHEFREQTVEEGENLQSINLKSLVKDADNKFEELKWYVSGNEDIQVLIGKDGKASFTTPSPDWNGIETLNFMVTDPAGATANQSLTLTVNSVNDIPVMKDIPTQTIDEGKTFADIKLDDFVSDADHKVSEISWEAVINTTGKKKKGKKVESKPTLDVFITAARVAKITVPNENWNGKASITFRGEDPEGGKVSKTVTYTVRSVNDLPKMTTLPAQVIQEGELFEPVSLNDIVEDADHPKKKLKWTVSGGKDIRGSIGKGNVLQIKTPGSEWNGKETFVLTATDPEGGKGETKLQLEVQAVNDAPVLKGLKGQNILEGKSFQSFKLDNFVSDVDDDKSKLKWAVTGNDKLKIKISADRSVDVIIPGAEWSGEETLTFTVTDAAGESASSDLTFKVNDVNDPPVLKKIPDQSVEEGKKFVPISLTTLVTDVDHQIAELEWSFKILKAGEHPTKKKKGSRKKKKTVVKPDLSVDFDGTNAVVTIPDEEWSGARKIIFTVKDPAGGKASTEALFTVKSVNDLPVLQAMPTMEILEGEKFETLKLDNFVEDKDNSKKKLSWNVTGLKDLKISINAKKHTASIKVPNKDWAGTETAVLTVTDPAGGKANTKLVLKVTPVNDAPKLKKMKGQKITEGEKFANIKLSELVTDVDNKTSELKWTISGNSGLKAVIAGEFLKISTPDKEWSGPAENIQLTVTDPGGESAEVSAKFEVLNVNDAPLISKIPGQSVQEGTEFKAIDLDKYVKDVDDKTSSLTWIAGDCIDKKKRRKRKKTKKRILPCTPVIAQTEIYVEVDPATHQATFFTPDENWNGKEELKFTVVDPAGAKASVVIPMEVKAVNDKPQLSMVTDQTVDQGKSFKKISLDDLVFDPDHKKSQLKWKVKSGRHLDVKITGKRIAVISSKDSEWSGKERITFSVQDPAGAKSEKSATFTVVHVNAVPKLKKIKGQTVREDKAFKVIRLDQYVSDTDHKKNLLRWKVTGNSQLQVRYDYLNRTVTIEAPRPDWNGPAETLTFTVTDPEGAEATGKAVFKVTPVNDAPRAVSHSYSTNEGEALKVGRSDGVLKSSTDPDGDPPKKAVLVKKPTNGKLNFKPDGSFVYVPKKGFNGSDEFTYKAVDKKGSKSKTARVDLTVFFKLGDVRGEEKPVKKKKSKKKRRKKRR